MSWHPNEADKLMFAETDGWVKIYHVEKGSCIFSMHSGRTHLESGGWAPSFPFVVGVGWTGGFSLCNFSEMSK